MDVAHYREKLKNVYPNSTWRDKVKKMSEDQVVAIFLALRKQNKL
jgi:hypothetical protein